MSTKISSFSSRMTSLATFSWRWGAPTRGTSSRVTIYSFVRLSPSKRIALMVRASPGPGERRSGDGSARLLLMDQFHQGFFRERLLQESYRPALHGPDPRFAV